MNNATTGSLGFDREIAQLVGVECAVLYQNISFWVETNRANNRNFVEGKYWTYNSARAFAELFPFWSSSKVVRLLIKLEESNLIESGEFNKQGYDRTKWYTICQNRQMDSLESANGVAKNGKAIPDINTDIKPDTNIIVRKEKTAEVKYTKDDIRLTDSLYHTIAKIFPNHKQFSKRKAKDSDYLEMNKLHRLDGYSYKQIEDVMKWLYTGYQPSEKFDWKRNILSTNKLRQKFFQLSEQFDADKKAGRYRSYSYSTKAPSDRKPVVAAPVEKERVVSQEEADKNRVILDLVRAKKVSFSDMKTLKSKTLAELKEMLNPV